MDTREICTGQPVRKKFRKLAAGALVAAALTIPVASGVMSVASSKLTPHSSHRLALGVSSSPAPASVRLTK